MCDACVVSKLMLENVPEGIELSREEITLVIFNILSAFCADSNLALSIALNLTLHSDSFQGAPNVMH